MYIQQVDLIRGAGQDFVDGLTAASVKEKYAQGAILFEKGDPADSFFFLALVQCAC